MVLGISPDPVDSHRRFATKLDLPFRLLSDPDRKVMAKYGAWGEKTLYGKKSIGAIRSTAWVGPDGKLVRRWKKVSNAAEHPEQVLKALREAVPAG